jgi:hypothetical protein
MTSRKLDTSVEASGPHDFAVRKLSALVFSAACVHRIQPRVHDDRETPLGGTGQRKLQGDLGLRKIRIFLQKGLDRPSPNSAGDLPVGSGAAPAASASGDIGYGVKPTAGSGTTESTYRNQPGLMMSVVGSRQEAAGLRSNRRE